MASLSFKALSRARFEVNLNFQAKRAKLDHSVASNASGVTGGASARISCEPVATDYAQIRFNTRGSVQITSESHGA
eukprot:3838811-Pleurochrysis_carterae.AAC.2